MTDEKAARSLKSAHGDLPKPVGIALASHRCGENLVGHRLAGRTGLATAKAGASAIIYVPKDRESIGVEIGVGADESFHAGHGWTIPDSASATIQAEAAGSVPGGDCERKYSRHARFYAGHPRLSWFKDGGDQHRRAKRRRPSNGYGNRAGEPTRKPVSPSGSRSPPG